MVIPAPRSPHNDLVLQAARAGIVDWTRVPHDGAARARARLQEQEARAVARTLWIAALLSLNRALLLPWWVGGLVRNLPPDQHAQFAGYLDPAAISAATAFAGFFAAAAIYAYRRPLLASTLCVFIFCAGSLPLVVANPALVGGGNLGRVVMLLLLGRALVGGFVHRYR
jgi:hypothetical protein